MNIIEIKNICKSFQLGTQEIPILKDISFDIKSGDFLVIFGQSGCGKSTLLHTILGLEPPTSGKINFLSENIYDGRSEDDRSEFRKLHVGMVYQQPNWIKSLSVINNVAFPLLLLGIEKPESIKRAYKALEITGMTNWAENIPSELSSGQQQKIALARALITDPEVVIADEPTGNLDYESGQELMQLLTDFSNNQQKTIIMVTHDLEYLKYAKSSVKMFNGGIVGVYDEKETQGLLSEIKSKRGIKL